MASGDRLAAIAHWCAALSDADADWLPPVEVIRALYASVEPDHAGRRPISRTRFAGLDAPFLRAALRTIRTHGQAGTLRSFLDEELHVADQWWRATWPCPDSNQRHGGWAWIIRQARAWHAETRRRLACNDRPLCRPALAEFRAGGYGATALTTALALFEEGSAMRNCLGGYAGRVSGGRVLVYAIRPHDGQGVAASAEFQRDARGCWHVAAARAFANQPAPESVLRFCDTLVDAINQAHRARRARMAQAVRRDRRRQAAPPDTRCRAHADATGLVPA